MLVTMFLLFKKILLMVHWFKIYLMVFFGVVSHIIVDDIVFTQEGSVFIGFVVLV
jgi:hypothetical protein